MIFLTTTAIEIDEELLNRCLVLTVDEDREQTPPAHQQNTVLKSIDMMLRDIAS
jgi:DNA primase